jgi:hypothetical protein
LPRQYLSTNPRTSIDNRPERPHPGGSAGSPRGLTRKHNPLTNAIAAVAVAAVSTAAILVTLWPAGKPAASATPAATRTAVTRAALAASSRQIRPTVITVAASSGQNSHIRAIEAWLASRAAWLPQPVELVVTVAPPPPPPPPPPTGAPAQQVTPVAAVPTATPSGSAQQIAMAMLASYGWSSSQFGCLDPLWERESGWNVFAYNPDGAYGIPQADPGSKMASAGPDWESDAATQITWGLSYIQATYGSPCAAWSHEEATGWY